MSKATGRAAVRSNWMACVDFMSEAEHCFSGSSTSFGFTGATSGVVDGSIGSKRADFAKVGGPMATDVTISSCVAFAEELVGTSTPQVAVTAIAHVVCVAWGSVRVIRSAIRRLCARALRVTNNTSAASIDCMAVRRMPKIRLCLESTVDHA